MIEHVVGRRGLRARATRLVSKTVILPTLSIYPLHGPLVRFYPVVDKAFAPHPRSRRVQRRRVDGSDWVAEYVEPKGGATREGAVLYMHGGAFVVCGLHTHRPLVDTLAVRTGMPVLSVAYRMHPHGTVEHALEDCLAALDVLIEEGIDPEQIVLAGDSAGGHLAFALALALRERRITPAAIVGFSPWLDFDHQAKLSHPNRRLDVMIPAGRLRAAALAVLGVDQVEDHHSPVNADLRGLPPVLMMCADDEVLRHDAELMYERLVAAGVPVRLQVWSGVLHAFPAMPFPVPEIFRSRRIAARFIRETVDAAAQAESEVA